MKNETRIIPDANERTRIEDSERGFMTRTEAMSSEGWLLSGIPVEDWVDMATQETAAVEYLARKIAEAEGLAFPSEEWLARQQALVDEARAFARDDAEA